MALRLLCTRATTVNSCLHQQFRTAKSPKYDPDLVPYQIPSLPNVKKRQIELMMPNEEAGKRFWWKEDGTFWHMPPNKKFMKQWNYRNVKRYPVQVTDPEKILMLRKLIGPRTVYRDTPWFKHDCDYKPYYPEKRVGRQFLGLAPSRKL